MMRWTLPTGEHATEGLGRGLAYAIDASLCDVLLPHVADSRNGYWRVGCSDVHNVIRRAFATWAANNPSVSFYDVGPSCDADSGAECSVAEVYVQARTLLSSEPPTSPKVVVELRTSDAVPLTTAPNAAPRAGLPPEVRTITKATISLIVDSGASWYYDTSVCNGMFSQTFDTIAFAYAVWVLSLIAGLAWGARLFYRTCLKDKPRDVCSYFHGTLAVLEHVWKLVSILLLLIIPAVMLFGFLQPCVYDQPLEPALLHGVGAALGLGNVSDPGAIHLALAQADDNTGCNSMRSITNTNLNNTLPCSSKKWWECNNRNATVMIAVAPVYTSNGLSQDDVDGLEALYPRAACNATGVSNPLNVPSATWYAGWTLLASCAVPLAILAFILPPCAAFARYLHTGCSPVPAHKIGDRPEVVSIDVGGSLSGREYAM